MPIAEFVPEKRTINTPFFTLKRGRNNLGKNRYAIVISTKVDKRSTRRHLWKRRLLKVLEAIPNTSTDHLIIVNPHIKEAKTASEVLELLEGTIKKP